MNDSFIRIQSDTYITISNVFLKDVNLSSKAKGIMAIIMALPPDWDFSTKGIISIVKEGDSAVRSAIKELIKYGYCSKKAIREKGKFSKWQYIFCADGNINNQPFSDFPHVDNSQVENQAQYNNIKNNISSINTPDKKEKNKKTIKF